jgi:hypothetical protein
MLGRVATAIGVLLLVGCAHDPLVVANVYPGLVPVRAPQGPLTPVLFSAAGTPAQQGFLYIAMYDAGVAAQNASLAQAATRPEEVKTRVGEVMYAIDPEAAPAWPAKATGIVEVWAGSGYGMRRAVRRMNEVITAALEQQGGSDALRTYGPGAIRCAENTLERAERVLALSDQVLAAGTDAELKPILRELDQVATALNNGVPAPGDEGCGLQQTFLYLEQLGPYSPSYRGV